MTLGGIQLGFVPSQFVVASLGGVCRNNGCVAILKKTFELLFNNKSVPVLW